MQTILGRGQVPGSFKCLLQDARLALLTWWLRRGQDSTVPPGPQAPLSPAMQHLLSNYIFFQNTCYLCVFSSHLLSLRMLITLAYRKILLDTVEG